MVPDFRCRSEAARAICGPGLWDTSYGSFSVEVAGIEPASFSFSVGILRAQIEKICRPWTPSISRPVAYPNLKSFDCLWDRQSKQVPLVVAQACSVELRTAERCLLFKRQGRVVARRLFYVSGSFTWLRRPRLASPTSTTKVEACHPHGLVAYIHSSDPNGVVAYDLLRALASSLSVSL